MECRCGCQDGEYKQGVSKKNGKPWKGWKCSACNEMSWLKTETPKGTAPTAQGGDLKSICVLLEDIKSLLCAKLMGAESPKAVKAPAKAKRVVDEDDVPPLSDEDAPF